MNFEKSVDTKYRDAIGEAIGTIIEKGNKQHRNTARMVMQSDVEIRFVPLDEIRCSGVTGVIDSSRANKRINSGEIEVEDALSEAYIAFSDWTFDVAGQRGCQGTLVHEGLHAVDFARIISSFSKAASDSGGVHDLTLYELERRAAITSAEYLVLIGTPDYIDDGLKLSLVALDPAGKPFVDMPGIENRMQSGYGLNENNQGVIISQMLGLKKKGDGFSFRKLFGLRS